MLQADSVLQDWSSPRKEVLLGLLSVSSESERSSGGLSSQDPKLLSWLTSGRGRSGDEREAWELGRDWSAGGSARGISAMEFLKESEIPGFLFGVIEGAGEALSRSDGTPALTLSVPKGALRSFLQERCGPGAETDVSLCYAGVGALDALGKVYDGQFGAVDTALSRRYRSWCRSVLAFASDDEVEVGTILVERLQANGVIPHKERVSDSGYDVTIVDIKKTLSAVTLYGTGIRVQPPHGWYFDVVPRSSIIKRGYMLANSVGVIDRAYRGELLIPLAKIDPSTAALELPLRIAQLIPRPIVHFPVQEVDSLSVSHRGEKGFGSSGE